MYRFFRPFIFKLDPENAHRLTLNLIRVAGSFPLSHWFLEALFAAPAKPVEAFGIRFKNPVGLAAGYDKDATALRGLASLGFGHLEVGTITPRPQPGNPRPRIFRLVEDEALINRMGFPGEGANRAAASLHKAMKGIPRHFPAVIGVNIGKNKDTPLEDSARDYVSLIRLFTPFPGYLAINISSPNTAGLRRLQGRAMLEELLGAVERVRKEISLGRAGHCPVLVKLAPDLDENGLDDAIDVILRTGMDGVIATNTTLARPGLASVNKDETGGLSGRPLARLSETVLRKVVQRLDGRLPVISVGGIMSPQDARRRLDMGASLVQVYTGLIYTGPGIVKAIIQDL